MAIRRKHSLFRVRVNRDIGQPLYQQVADALRSWLSSPETKPGDQLPVELKLCKWFGVSRGTMRRALGMLAGEGLIRRRQRAGSFVVRPLIRQQLGRYLSFTESCRQRGIIPSSRVVRLRTEGASGMAAVALGLPRGSRVVFLERVRYADGEAVCLDAVFAPEARFATSKQHDFASESLFEVLAQESGVILCQVKGWLKPVLAGKREARLLGTKPGSPMLLLETVVSAQDGTLVLFSREIWRGDRTQYLLG